MSVRCNQVCKHCHVDADPDRKEIMTRETMNYAWMSATPDDQSSRSEGLWPHRKITLNISMIRRCDCILITRATTCHSFIYFGSNPLQRRLHPCMLILIIQIGNCFYLPACCCQIQQPNFRYQGIGKSKQILYFHISGLTMVALSLPPVFQVKVPT
jgi:hypothetical protein